MFAMNPLIKNPTTGAIACVDNTQEFRALGFALSVFLGASKPKTTVVVEDKVNNKFNEIGKNVEKGEKSDLHKYDDNQAKEQEYNPHKEESGNEDHAV